MLPLISSTCVRPSTFNPSHMRVRGPILTKHFPKVSARSYAPMQANPVKVSISSSGWGLLSAAVAAFAASQFLDDKKVWATTDKTTISQTAIGVGGNVEQKQYYISVLQDPKTALHFFELSVLPKFNERYVPRASVEEAIIKALAEGKKSYLRGPGGMGKTQLALHYAHTHKEKYDHFIFINCENIDSLKESLAQVVSHLNIHSHNDAEEAFFKFIKSTNSYWGSKIKKSLIIVDNVDDKVVYDMIKPLLEWEIPGDVIITGRYDIQGINALTTLDVNTVTPAEAQNIFITSLNSTTQINKLYIQGNKLDAISHFLIKDLGGSPLIITLAAAFINSRPKISLTEAKSALTLPSGLTAEFLTAYKFDKEDLRYHNTLIGATWPNIKAIKKDLPLGSHQIFDDFIRFISFMAPYQQFSLEVDSILVQTLAKYSPKKEEYQQDEAAILYALKIIINELNKHSLLLIEGEQKTEKGYSFRLNFPLPVKSSIIYKSLNKLEPLRKQLMDAIATKEKKISEEWGAWLGDKLYLSTLDTLKEKHYQVLDNERYRWFKATVDYLARAPSPDLHSFSHVVEFLDQYFLSELLKLEMFNLLTKPFQNFTDQLQKDPANQEFREKVNRIDLDKLRTIMDAASNKIGIQSAQVAQAYFTLSEIFLEKDLAKSEEILFNIEKLKDKKGYDFHLGRYYYYKALASASSVSKRSHLEEAIKKFNANANYQKAATYYMLALCSQELLPFQNSSDALLGQSEIRKYYKKAIAAEPFNEFYERTYSIFLQSIKKEASSLEHAKRALILADPQFQSLPEPYKQKLVEYVRSKKKEHTFADDWMSSYLGSSKKVWITDGGQSIAQIIPGNKNITKLRFYDINITSATLKVLVGNLLKSSHVEELHLDSLPTMTDQDNQLLIPLMATPTLKKLSLQGHKTITPSTATLLIQAAKPHFQFDFTNCATLKPHQQQLTALAKQHHVEILWNENIGLHKITPIRSRL